MKRDLFAQYVHRHVQVQGQRFTTYYVQISNALTQMRALFADQDSYVWTTWSGGLPIDDFIRISREGFHKGARIAHRVNGGTVDIAISGGLHPINLTYRRTHVLRRSSEWQKSLRKAQGDHHATVSVNDS